MTRISVVVPTFNRREQLGETLTSLASQTVDPSDVEVIVVSDGSTDGTDEVLETGRTPLPVIHVRQKNQGPAAARNAGAAAASGEILVFIDDDVVAAPECLHVHRQRHECADSPIVVIGPLLTPVDARFEPWVAWEQAMLTKQYEAMAEGRWTATSRQFYTGNASLLRAEFAAAGGFDPSFRRAEDVEFAYRLAARGLEFVFEPEARADHYARRSFDSWLAIASSYGRNDVVFSRDLGQSWLLPVLRAEYDQRHPLTRAFTRLGLAAPPVSRLATWAAIRWCRIVARRGREDAGHRVLSAIYNLAYYESLTAELGGLRAFLDLTPEHVRPPTGSRS